MKSHIELLGVLLVILALIHVVFPRKFRWKEELASLSLINRQIMWVHTLFIALAVLLMGLLCLTAAEELTTTDLGKKVSLGLAVFWSVRLLIQFFGYSSELWRGKLAETSIHVLFSGLWIYLSSVFWWNFFR